MAKAKRKPKNLGELKESGWQRQTVKQEMRRNLIARIEKGKEHFPGIIGFEETVVPFIENAVISGQDVIFLGERGQAKSRLIRSLVNLLDDEIPAVAGCEINDDPLDPICARCRGLLAKDGDKVEIEVDGLERLTFNIKSYGPRKEEHWRPPGVTR